MSPGLFVVKKHSLTKRRRGQMNYAFVMNDLILLYESFGFFLSSDRPK